MNSRTILLLAISGFCWCIAASGGAAVALCVLAFLCIASYGKKKAGEVGWFGLVITVCCIVHAVTVGFWYGLLLFVSAVLTISTIPAHVQRDQE